MDVPIESKSKPRVAAEDHDDGADEVDCKEDDAKSTTSSEVSDGDTLARFLLVSRPATPAFESETRELGLSASGWFSDFTDYDVITVHGLRDNHSTMWKSKGGFSWLQLGLFGSLSVRQLDFIYATHDSARVFQPDGIEVEARNLLQLYAEKRRSLPDTEVHRPIIWVCHDIGGTIVKKALIEASQAIFPSDFEDLETWEHMREARGQIAKLSTTIISLGCPHKTESIDVLEDELHNLMSLPGPDINSGLIRKIKNVASQVEDTNNRFLDAKLFSRLVHINVFHLQSLRDLKADEKMPIGETGLGFDNSNANNNEVQNESGPASSEEKRGSVAAGTLQSADNNLAAPNADVNAKDVNEDKPVHIVVPLEAADNHADKTSKPMDTDSSIPDLCTLRKKNENVESPSGLVASKDTFHHSESPRPALTELPILRGSPFGRYTTCLYSMFEVDSRYRQSKIDHAALVRGDEDIVETDSWVAGFKTRFDADHYSLKASHDLNDSQFALLSLAPPTRPPKVHRDPDAPEKPPFLDWIIAHEKFKMFDESMGPYTLCIQGVEKDASRMALVSQQLYIWYESEKTLKFGWGNTDGGTAFYFQFDRFDSRLRSIKSMLAVFLSETTWRMWSKPGEGLTTHRLFRSLEYYRNWSLPVLFNLFTEMRRCKGVEKFVIFLGCFDNCVEEERNWFLAKVLEHQSRTDLSYRLVITTSGQDKVIKESLHEAQVISLDEFPAPVTGYAIDEKGLDASGLEPYLKDVLRKRPVLRRLEKSLQETIEQYQREPRLGYIVLNWLRHFGRGLPIADITVAVNKLRPATPQTVLSVLISTLPLRKKRLAIAIFRWVKYAQEPMTVETLGHALAASADSDTSLLDVDHDQLLQDVQRIFSGAVVVEGHILKFSHESFYDTTIPDDDGDENPPSIHGLLAKTCLKYLMHQEVQQRYDKLSVDNYSGNILKKPLVLPGDDLLEYAVRFWAEHHRLSESYRPTELALDFFRSAERRKSWAEAYYLLSNPFTRIHRGYASPLPLIAALGLEDVMSQRVKEEEHSRWFQQDAWLAITEATRNGHNHIVYQLLERVQLQESGLQDAIIWVTSPGNESALTELLKSIGSLEEFTWPKYILFRAAAFGLDSLVSALAKAGYNLNERNEDTGETAIHTAIAWGQKTVVKLLLDSKVDLSVRDDLGRTPLLSAVEFGQPEIVQMLLDAGASVNDKHGSGVSVVNKAICAGEIEALKRLLAAGADHSAVESNEDSPILQAPLICAAEQGRLHCIRILLEHGADPCIDSKEGTPLYILCHIPHVAECCRLLIEKGAEPNQVYVDKEMLLHRALRTEDKELVGLLIEKGAQVDSIDTYEDASIKTPLAFAIWSGPLEMVEFLLEKGASVNYVPEGAESPLFTTAFRNTDIKMAELLLKHKADINWERHDGWTALHAAYDMPAFVSLFLKSGADVNKMSDSGTLLMMAARWNFVGVLKLLLAHRPLPKLDLKFDYDPENFEYGSTALMLAVKSGNHECASLLLEAGAELDDKLRDAKFILQSANPNDSEAAYKMMRDVLDRGTTADRTDDDGNTALHGLSDITPVKILQTLIDLGAPVDSPNKDGLTPLGVAVEKGNVAAATYLISKGARADVYNPKFGSFLHLVCQTSYPENETALELLKLLIDARANPNIAGPEPSGESLLHAVIRAPSLGVRARARMLQYLIQNATPAVNVNASGGLWAFPVIAAAYGGHSDIFEYLIRHGADVDVADGLGRRPIHYLAGLGRWMPNIRAIRVLAKAGADMRATDHFGRTALHFVAGTDELELFELVLRKLPRGYDIDVQDNDGWTPLMWACRTSTYTPIIEKLVKTYRADIWPRSTDGEWSALKLACLSGQDEDVKALLQPPAHEREREGKDGSKQAWNSDFHNVPLGTVHPSGVMCDGCFVAIVGTRYKCTVCENFDMCFKCFPLRSEMHFADHELKEYYQDGFVGQEGNESLENSEKGDNASNHSEDNVGGAGSSFGVGTDTDDEDDFDSDDE